MPVPDKLKRSLQGIVLASRMEPDHLYYGIDLFIKEQEDFQKLLNHDAEKMEYAQFLLEQAVIANRRKGNIYGWNASRNYHNAEKLFAEALKVISVLNNPNDPSLLRLKATILTRQATFYESIVKDSSSTLKNMRKTPIQICEIYEEISQIGRTLHDSSRQTLAETSKKKHDTPENKIEAFKSKLAQFLKNADQIEYPNVLINLASLKVTNKNEIIIDPTWARAYSSTLVEGILKILELKENVDFTVQRNRVSSNKFIIKPGSFQKCEEAIDKAMAHLHQSKNKNLQEQKRQYVKESKESYVVHVSPTPDPKACSKGRTPPIAEEKITPSLDWKKEEAGKNIIRFKSTADEKTYIDVDKAKNRISSNSTSEESFFAIFTEFRKIYDSTILPMISVLDTLDKKNAIANCKAALVRAGYKRDEIEKIMTPPSVPKPSVSSELNTTSGYRRTMPF